MTGSQATSQYIETDLVAADLDAIAWLRPDPVMISSYWNGRRAPDGRRAEVRLLWSDRAVYVRFEAAQVEPLVVNDQPEITTKTVGLWERDVCEIFIAPDTSEPRRYFEFEVAPTGEWLDLTIDMTSGKRGTDWEYDSSMEAAARIEEGRVMMGMKIPWEAFGRKPDAGDVWLGNIFRCVGKEPDRGYLAWSPTMTEAPNFHVPEAFGEFRFTR